MAVLVKNLLRPLFELVENSSTGRDSVAIYKEEKEVDHLVHLDNLL